ncbi:MAG: Stp1/IreP family PP2C-type Ser/Thr phosphatase [Deltaproteobacteria bacterium]|nr:Stp1/IreP family PP2C-type Ser/Thr phosphatase [Deltaproteobacteria bacterium]
MLVEGSDLENELGFDQGEVHNSQIPAAVTDTGCERELNEDRYAVIESPSGLAWLVCDGMGGTSGGELAAQLAIDAIRRDLENLPARPAVAALKSAILEANRIIVLRRQNQAFAQMGTTIVGVIFAGSEIVMGHVGDSRAYLVRGGQIQQLTVDHTYVQELVEKGHIAADEALAHPQAHILTRAIGSEPGLEVDIQRFWIWEAAEDEPRDCLVLCTDGLYSHVTDREIAEIVTANNPQEACVKMVELAKARGGYDNITVAIIPVGGQVRQQPPAGASQVGSHGLGYQHKVPQARSSGRGLLKNFMIVIMLSLLGALLVVLGSMLHLSK